MKHTAKRILCLVLALLFVLPMAACGPDKALEEQLAAAQAQVATLEQELQAERSKPAEKETVTETVTETVEVPLKQVVGVNCTLNGADSVDLKDTATVHAVAVIPEGYAFDHWVVLGVDANTQSPEADFDVSASGSIVAVLHEKHVLTLVNCHFRFVDDKGKAGGEALTSFNFEEAYTNPVTKEECTGGLITGVVEADIPKDYEVDGWLINGVVYEPDSTVKSFQVTSLDEATVYEPILVKASTKMYTVTCSGCTFSGGGYKNATKGKVAAGTKITLTPTGSNPGRWTGTVNKGGVGSNQIKADPIKYTVNKNCTFNWSYIVY